MTPLNKNSKIKKTKKIILIKYSTFTSKIIIINRIQKKVQENLFTAKVINLIVNLNFLKLIKKI